MNKLIIGVAIIATLYMVFHIGRYYERTTVRPVNAVFNAGYRNGAYNVLAELVECHNLDTEILLDRYNMYRRLVNTYDSVYMDDNSYPCTE